MSVGVFLHKAALICAGEQGVEPMKFRVREEDTHFYLNKRKNGEYELLFHTGPRLGESICFSKERLTQFKKLLKNRNIHQT